MLTFNDSFPHFLSPPLSSLPLFLSFLFPFFLALDNLSTFLLALPFSLPYLLPTSPPSSFLLSPRE